MATDLWDESGFEASPAGSDQRSIVDDKIRQLKLAIRQRLAQGGHYVLDATPPYSKDGRHVRGSFALYKADGTTKMLDLPDDTHIDVQSGITFRAVSGSTLDFSAAPIVQTSILNNACSRISPTSAGTGSYNGALSSGVTLNSVSGITTGSPPGPTIIFANLHMTRGWTEDGTLTLNVEIDRANNGTWTEIGEDFLATATSSYTSTTYIVYDHSYATNGPTVNYRLRGAHILGTDNYQIIFARLYVLEARR